MGKDTLEQVVQTKRYKHEDLLNYAKNTDEFLVHLTHILHGYQKYLNESYRPKKEKLQELQAKAVKLSVRIAEETLSPLIAYEIQKASEAVNEKVVLWNKMLIRGIFISIACMVFITFFLRRGLLLGGIVSIVVMVGWIWYTSWMTGINGEKSNTTSNDDEAFDGLGLDEGGFAEDLRASKDCDTQVEDPNTYYDPNSIEAEIQSLGLTSKNSSKTHVQYLQRMNMMNRALGYMTSLQSIPESILESFQKSKSILEIYKESIRESTEKSKNE